LIFLIIVVLRQIQAISIIIWLKKKMDLKYPILVLSDIHFGHPASCLEKAEQLRPLFKNVETVVFNGDTTELLWIKNRRRAAEQAQCIADIVLSENAKPIFLTGNHDPIASSCSHLDLQNGATLVTHGDILFHEVAPWSKVADVVGEAHDEALSNLEEDALVDFNKRLIASKTASISLENLVMKIPVGKFAKLILFLREAWPPWNAIRVLKYWMQTPDRALALAQKYRPDAKFIIIGHTHREGIWQRDGRVIINTGSFLPPSGRRAVLLEKSMVIVKKIDFEADFFVFGKTVARYKVDPVRDDQHLEPHVVTDDELTRTHVVTSKKSSQRVLPD